MMPDLRSLATAALLKKLKEQGASNKMIIDIEKSDGREGLEELAK